MNMIFKYDTYKVEMKKVETGEVLAFGHPADVREKIEDLFVEKFGFHPTMQEDIDEDTMEYQVYLHTENDEDLEHDEEKINLLDELNITEEIEKTTAAIKEIFGLEFKVFE